MLVCQVSEPTFLGQPQRRNQVDRGEEIAVNAAAVTGRVSDSCTLEMPFASIELVL